jgi:hypothetical protein
MDITLTQYPPDVVLDVGTVSLRDIGIIDDNDEAFATYCEEARLTTGVALSLVVQSS